MAYNTATGEVALWARETAATEADADSLGTRDMVRRLLEVCAARPQRTTPTLLSRTRAWNGGGGGGGDVPRACAVGSG